VWALLLCVWFSFTTMDPYPPLGERVVKTSSTGLAVTYPLQSDLVCRSEYKRWSNESMALAVDAVMKDGLSVRRAVKVYNVPKSTLGDHISGRVLPGCQWASQVL